MNEPETQLPDGAFRTAYNISNPDIATLRDYFRRIGDWIAVRYLELAYEKEEHELVDQARAWAATQYNIHFGKDL